MARGLEDREDAGTEAISQRDVVEGRPSAPPDSGSPSSKVRLASTIDKTPLISFLQESFPGMSGEQADYVIDAIVPRFNLAVQDINDFNGAVIVEIIFRTYPKLKTILGFTKKDEIGQTLLRLYRGESDKNNPADEFTRRAAEMKAKFRARTRESAIPSSRPVSGSKE